MTEETIRLNLIMRRGELEVEKRKLKAELKAIDKEIAALDEPILSDFAKANLRNYPLASGATLYHKRFLHCSLQKGRTSIDAVNALQQAGWDWLVEPNYSPQRLKEHLKELVDRQEGPTENGPIDLLPSPLRDVFSIIEHDRVIILGADKIGKED